MIGILFLFIFIIVWGCLFITDEVFYRSLILKFGSMTSNVLFFISFYSAQTTTLLYAAHVSAFHLSFGYPFKSLLSLICAVGSSINKLGL